MRLMTGIELTNGLSADHGFSYQNLIMDAAGAGFAVVRNHFPFLADKVDFRSNTFHPARVAQRVANPLVGARFPDYALAMRDIDDPTLRQELAHTIGEAADRVIAAWDASGQSLLGVEGFSGAGKGRLSRCIADRATV